MGKTLYKQNRQERKLFSIAKTSVIGFRQIHSGDYDETLTQVTLLYSIKDIWWFLSYKIWWMDFQNTLLKLFFKDDWYVIQSVILKVQRIPRMHEISKIHLWIEGSIMELRISIQWVNQIVWWSHKWREVLCYKKFSGSYTVFLVFLI